MSSINDITGDTLISKTGDKEAYDRGYDAIFGKKDTSIQKRVIKEIADILGWDDSGIYLDSILVDDLKFDELDNIQLLINLEGAFSCEINDEAAMQFKTVQDIIDHLKKMMNHGVAK